VLHSTKKKKTVLIFLQKAKKITLFRIKANKEKLLFFNFDNKIITYLYGSLFLEFEAQKTCKQS